MKGWIRLHREMTDHWLWSGDPYSKGQAWIDILLHANFTDNDIMIKGQVVKLRRGQQARSELTLSEDWKWSRGKVRRFLKQLKSHKMIEQHTTHLTSVISVCNYDNYQQGDTAGSTASDTPDDTPDDTPHGTATEHLTVHSKESKKVKNDKKERKFNATDFKKSLAEQGAQKNHVDDWMDVRRKKKCHNSEVALNGFYSEVKKSGLSVQQVVQLCAEKSWGGFDSTWNYQRPSSLQSKFQQSAEQTQQGFLDNEQNVIDLNPGDFSHAK